MGTIRPNYITYYFIYPTYQLIFSVIFFLLFQFNTLSQVDNNNNNNPTSLIASTNERKRHLHLDLSFHAWTWDDPKNLKWPIKLTSHLSLDFHTEPKPKRFPPSVTFKSTFAQWNCVGYDLIFFFFFGHLKKNWSQHLWLYKMAKTGTLKYICRLAQPTTKIDWSSTLSANVNLTQGRLFFFFFFFWFYLV